LEQKQNTIEDAYSNYNDLLSRVSSLLKKDGQLLFSKIIGDELKSKFSKFKINDFFKDDDEDYGILFYKFDPNVSKLPDNFPMDISTSTDNVDEYSLNPKKCNYLI